jgi:hypothetical protein
MEGMSVYLTVHVLNGQNARPTEVTLDASCHPSIFLKVTKGQFRNIHGLFQKKQFRLSFSRENTGAAGDPTSDFACEATVTCQPPTLSNDFLSLVLTNVKFVIAAAEKSRWPILKCRLEEMCIFFFFQLGRLVEELTDLNFAVPRWAKFIVLPSTGKDSEITVVGWEPTDGVRRWVISCWTYIYKHFS